jgi:subfamily B ATP-binding cassette protein HlyB/CyaB
MAEQKSHSVVQCLTAIAQHHGLQVNPERLIEEHALSDEEPRPAQVIRMAAGIGLKGKLTKLSWKGLFAQEGVFPFIGLLKDGKAVIIVGVRAGGGGAEGEVAILNPLIPAAAVHYLDKDMFTQAWGGNVIFLKHSHELTDPQQPFSFRWFIPEILKQKAAFRDIAIAAVALSLLSMASPVFFQLVIDKVLVHQSVSTLWVLAAGILVALGFETVFSYVRQLLLLSATNKIDMQITRRAFGHLLSLPIDYFDSTSAGVVARVMQQLEAVRGFLTGRLFFTCLDTLTLLIYVPLLFSYSVKLGSIVLVFAMLIALIIAVSAAHLPAPAWTRLNRRRRRAPGPAGGNHPRHAHGQGPGHRTGAAQAPGTRCRRKPSPRTFSVAKTGDDRQRHDRVPGQTDAHRGDCGGRAKCV